MDNVDKILEQWNIERPDLDVTSMGVVGRLVRLYHHMSREMEKTFSRHELTFASFDVLATLRRSGEPYSLSPNELLATMMVTSGTMTNRIDRLETAGLVKRVKNAKDARSVMITLTDKGFKVINKAVTDHVATQTKLTKDLSKKELDMLNMLLSGFLRKIEDKSTEHI